MVAEFTLVEQNAEVLQQGRVLVRLGGHGLEPLDSLRRTQDILGSVGGHLKPKEPLN